MSRKKSVEKKTTKCCLDCFAFKMKKGWKYAYCSEGIMSNGDGSKDKLFMVRHPDGAGLWSRGRKLKSLNNNCEWFNG